MKLKDKIVKNRLVLLVTIGILLVVTILVGISYAYFFNIQIKTNNTISGNIKTNSYIFNTNGTGSLSITLDNDKLDISNASNNYTSYASNTGGNINVSLDANGLNKVYCSYDLVYVPSTAYTPSEGATNAGLKEFTLSGTSDKGNSFSEIDVSGSSAVTLISGIKISTDTNILEKWSFTVKYYNLDVIQDNVIGKTFKGNIKVTNTNCSFNEPVSALGGDYVLLKSTGASSVAEAKSQIESKTKPDFSTVTTTNDKDIFSAPDDLGTSYYFRGAVDNNWVKFGKDSTGKDIYWRIIRINGDGSIRMIYSGTTAPDSSTATVMAGTETHLSKSNFNSRKDKAEYVGYQYIDGQQYGYGECNGVKSTCTVNGHTVHNSIIKQKIDIWYAQTTLEKDEVTKTLVSQEQIFCNDRSASSDQTAPWTSTGEAYFYGAYGRLYSIINKTPMLTCPKESDKFTSKDSSVGNKALDYPVGLITADEVAMAGGVVNGDDNSSYYLYTGQYYWTGSPRSNDTNGLSTEFVAGIEYLDNNATNSSAGIRPVVSLSSKAKLLGSGTYNDVYRVN